MAMKEIPIKIKVEGKEIELTSKQIDLFKKNAESLRKELESLGKRTEENAEQFDKLKGDLDELDNALNEVKQSTKENTEAVKESEQEYTSMGERVGKLEDKLATLRLENKQGTEEYKKTAKEIRRLRDVQEELDITTQKTLTTFSQIPGPIGFIAGGFESLRVGFKSAQIELKKLGLGFKTLDKAILSTGIGAIVIVFGLLVAAVVKAFKSFKPLQDAVERFGVLFEVVGQVLDPIVELIGVALTEALNFLSKAIAFVTGNLDEFNQKLADKAAAEQAAKNIEKQKFDLETLGDTYTEVQKKIVEARLNAADKIKAINEDEVLSEEEKAERILQINERLARDIQSAIDEDNKQKEQKAKESADKARQIEEDYQSRLKTLRDENELAQIKNEEDRQKRQLEITKDAQLKEIESLKVSEKKKQELVNETLKNYEIKIKEINDKVLFDRLKADNDLLKQAQSIRLSLMDNEEERLKEESKIRAQDALVAIKESDASEEAKKEARLAIVEKYKDEIKKINEKIVKNERDSLYATIESDREIRQIGLQNRLKEIDLSTQSELAKIQARSMVFAEQAKIDNEKELLDLQNLLSNKEIDQDEYFNRVLQLEQTYALNLKENSIKTEEELRAQRMANIDAIGQLAGAIGQAATAMGEESAAGKVLTKVQQGLALASTSVALAEAFRGLGKDMAKGFPANIIAVTSTLALIASAISQFKQLTGTDIKSGGSSSSSSSGNNLGRNYATGGIVTGPGSSTSDSIPINVSNGEAVMTAGAVSMFKPMLSMMNQMGGGTSFAKSVGVSLNDNPDVKTNIEPVIIKSYVVSNELTNEVEKQARLKDLSTL